MSVLNTALTFLQPAKVPDAEKETVSIKMRIDDTIYKDYKTNYETKSFKVIETFGYNIASVVKTIHAIDL